MPNIALREESDFAPQVRAALARVFAQIHSLLPEVEVEHIGATAIPGAITKGDLDVMVRVPPSQFDVAVAKLKTVFAVKQPKNWNESFASFGDDTAYGLPLGVQLVVKDSESDFFLYLRDHFIQHPDALAAYNELKLRNANKGSDAYWQAKHIFLSEILAARPK
jgi:GrpB-like predicted nucleotidyltransferase (UPF0157 family)